MRTFFKSVGAATVPVWVTASLLGPVGAAQQPPPAPPLDVVEIQPNFHMIAGAGANIAVETGPDGIVIVDSGSGQRSDAVVAELRKLSNQPLRYIINTGPDADHVGGNEALARAGQSLFAAGNFGPGGAGGNTVINNGGSASIIGTENLLTRMSAPSGERSPYPSVAWPTETFTRKQKNLYLNNEGIEVITQPAAHTDGDSIVFFRRSDVVVTGDIFDMTRFPVIDVTRGGSVEGEIAALNRLIDLVIPSIPLPWKEGGTQVIPGHGRVCEQAEIVEYRDMVTIVRDRVQDLIKAGRTLEQIKAASPTKGWNARFGATSGPWTTDMFVEAVYKGLAPSAAPAPAKTARKK